jgi:protocatechuate 3,4-dioxygenase beta subunit
VAEQYIPRQIDRTKAKVHTVAAGQTVVADDSVLPPASVSGRLVDGEGRPQADFQVYLSSTDEQHTYGTTTDSDGAWRVDDVQPADYRVSFSNPAGARTQWAFGKSGAADAQAIAVAAGASVTVDDTWLPGATLTVKAVDEATGAPVTDFCVDVEAGSGYTQGCASGGTAIVTDLAPGRASVAVVPGEETYFLRDDDNPVTLVAGESASVTVPLAKGGKVSFSAVDGVDGKAVTRTCFALLTPGRGGLPDGYGDCTNAQGRSTSRTIAPGTYQLFAIAPGTYGHQWVGPAGGTGDQRAAARIVVKADGTVAAPAARLDKAGSISGVVTGTDGAPIEDADVSFTAWGFGSGSIHSVTTNSRGRYTIGKLGPYAWPLSFTANAHPRQWSGNVGNRFKAVHIPVAAGATATYDMALTSTSTLSGKVVVPAGLPATGWRLTLVNVVTGDQMAELDSYAQQPGGKFSVRVAGPQQVKIHWSARNEDGLDADGWHDHATDQASAKRVGVPASGTKRVTVTLG